MSVKVSVIIPAYNAEKTITRTILSVISQTMDDIEIIVIINGTTDNTYEISRKTLNNQTRFSWNIILEEEGNVGKARNIGIENAEGEFLFFLDADDYIENNALENLDPSHIISDSERLTDIDSIMRKNSRHGTGIVIKVANLYIKFLRQNEIKIKSPEQLQNLFKKWLKKNNFLYYIIFLFVSFYKDIFYFFTNKDVLDDSFWSNYMKVFDIIGMAIPYQDMVEEIIKELDIKYTDKILDAGSGTGTLSIEIKKKYPVEMIGVDNSETALKIHLSKDPEANLVKSDLTNLKFPDNEFDKLICMLTLHSIPYEFRARVLSEFYRVLKPGGKIVLSNPYSNFSPNRIFIEHIKKDLRKSGLIKVLKDSIKHFIPIIKMFYYNNLIKREEKKRDGVLLSFNEQKELLEKTGFNNVSDTRVLYSKSAIINSAYK